MQCFGLEIGVGKQLFGVSLDGLLDAYVHIGELLVEVLLQLSALPLSVFAYLIKLR